MGAILNISISPGMGIRCRSRKNKGQACPPFSGGRDQFSYHVVFTSFLGSIQIWSYLARKSLGIQDRTHKSINDRNYLKIIY